MLIMLASWADDPGSGPGGAAALLSKLLVIAVVVGILWLLLRPQYRFVIEVRRGQARLRRGRAAAAFLREIEDVFRDQGLDSGSVMALPRGRELVLRFSRQVPESCRQRIRNLHRLHG